MARTYGPRKQETPELQFGPLLNSELFSNHWLANRLPLEPEWHEERDAARAAFEALLSLWEVERDRVAQYPGEPALEYGFIQPVFEALGWKLVYQTKLRGDRPDYALFLDDDSKNAALAAGAETTRFWQYAAVLADAKSWNRKLDRAARTNNQREYPPEQIERYLRNGQLGWAILTNGRHWRLIPGVLASDQTRFQTYLEADLPALLAGWNRTADLFPPPHALDEFLRFYLLFSPVAHRKGPQRQSLVQRAVAGSSAYRLGVGDDLQARVFDALRWAIDGFLHFAGNGLDPKSDLDECRQQSFVLLYRLLFIMYAEDRGLLPYRRHQLYTDNRSLARHRDEVASQLDWATSGRGKDFARDATGLWADLLLLFDLIDQGRNSYGVPAYNGGLFDPGEQPRLAQWQMGDFHLARVIDCLSRAEEEQSITRDLYRVDYRDLQIQHLGNIYEGLLELQPHIATEPLIVVRPKSDARGREERTIPASRGVPRNHVRVTTYQVGDVHLLNSKGERRASGSYYTPNQIVDYLVEKALGPVCLELNTGLAQEIATTEGKLAAAPAAERAALEAELERLRASFDDRVLQLRVLDPAMGSGHFLLRACQYLAVEIATNPHTGDPAADQFASDESALNYWKRRIVERCLFGVDKNPLAVELAKLALWLETVSSSQPLSFLDHHLRWGDSLVGAALADMDGLPGDGGLKPDTAALALQQKLHALLRPLANIRDLPSDTAAQVKTKVALYRDDFERARAPFLHLAHFWCAHFFQARPMSDEAYCKALGVVDDPAKFEVLAKAPTYQTALRLAAQRDMGFCHWELEFPEAYFTPGGRRRDAGFDAIIGNPPYDVLAAKEVARDLRPLQEFLRDQPQYDASFRGKNNLYKLFICRAMHLLRDGGRLGFIVPMALLGDDQAAGLRRAMLEAGAWEIVDAFPQKDDPSRRVFPAAKLSTTAFTWVKTDDPERRNQTFTSRVHPAMEIVAASPSLQLRSSDIPDYDATNLSIVTCSQADWDLAVRIVKSGRMARLGTVAKFKQGEVNETVVRTKKQLVVHPREGRQVLRGAGICLYVLRPASQGEEIYLNVKAFLAHKERKTKAFHHKQRRVGLQESCPQNNFRRLIASLIPEGQFCNHLINYVPEDAAGLPLELILAILNSRLSDWYFRLGSSNNHVSHYQLQNLPCPRFVSATGAGDRKLLRQALTALEADGGDAALAVVAPALAQAPFDPIVCDLIIELVKRIMAIEAARGEIPRSMRSALDPQAQPYQDLIDRLFYAMAGLTPAESAGLEERLAHML